jgi:hypothetical protein
MALLGGVEGSYKILIGKPDRKKRVGEPARLEYTYADGLSLRDRERERERMWAAFICFRIG